MNLRDVYPCLPLICGWHIYFMTSF